jgi:hypothetical protein
MADIVKPLITDTDVWANSADKEEDILVPYEKIDEGWSYANKPSYQYLNWFWQTQTQFYAHLNQNGIPEWDEESVYSSSGFTKHEDIVYQSFSDSKGFKPQVDSRVWRSLDFLNGLYDVEVDMPAYRDLLIWEKGLWKNNTPRDLDVNLNQLNNVEDPGSAIDLVLSVKDTDQTAPDAWAGINKRTVIANKLYISDFEDTRITNPVPGEILKFQEYKMINPTTGEEEITHKWQNTYYQGYVNWNNIKNLPNEFKCAPAGRTQVGGARMWSDDTDPAYPKLYIETTRIGYVPKPYGLTNTTEETDTGIVKLSWTGNLQSDKYNLYRDGVKVSDTGTNVAFAIDTPGDTSWHVYYVTSVDTIGGTEYESDPSNYLMAKVNQ